MGTPLVAILALEGEVICAHALPATPHGSSLQHTIARQAGLMNRGIVHEYSVVKRNMESS